MATIADQKINEIINGRGDMSPFMLILQGIVEREMKKIDNPIIIELGVRAGDSTLALLNAIRNIGKGQLYSADIEDCEAAHKNILEAELYSFWYFKKIDSVDFASSFKECDFIFIDTSHEYEHTLNELKTWSTLLKKEGKIVLHDTLSTTEVKKAIDDFLKTNKKWGRDNIDIGPGLCILTKKG